MTSRLFDHLGNFGSRAKTERNMLPSLGIIVPYRDRADHLDEFLFEAISAVPVRNEDAQVWATYSFPS